MAKINKEDFENLRGSFSRAIGALRPSETHYGRFMDKFDALVKPLVGEYDSVDVLVKLTYKDLQGNTKTFQYRPIQKPFAIPEDVKYFHSTIKVVAKVGDVTMETKEEEPFMKTPAVYVIENLTEKQQKTLRAKIKQPETFMQMTSLEDLNGYISIKPSKKVGI